MCCSKFANPFKVEKFGRAQAIELFAKHLNDNPQLQSAIWTLSGLRLVCHSGAQQVMFLPFLPRRIRRERCSDQPTANVPISSTTLQNSEKSMIRARVQRLTKVRGHLGQDGQEQGSRCKSASVIHSVIFAMARGSMATNVKALPSVRDVEGCCGTGQKVLRTFRDNGAPAEPGTRARQGMPFPGRSSERTQGRSCETCCHHVDSS